MVWAKEAMVTSITIMEDLPSVTWTQDPTGPSFSYSPSTKVVLFLLHLFLLLLPLHQGHLRT